MITNEGHAYDKQTGVFTAPLAGTYVFNINLVAQIGHYVEASIQHNGKPQVTAISDFRTYSENSYKPWDQGEATVILKLQKGDVVSVTLLFPNGSHEVVGHGKTGFSGFLLWPAYRRRSYMRSRNHRVRFG